MNTSSFLSPELLEILERPGFRMPEAPSSAGFEGFLTLGSAPRVPFVTLSAPAS